MKTVIIKISESKQKAYTKGMENLNMKELAMLKRLLELMPQGIKQIEDSKSS